MGKTKAKLDHNPSNGKEQKKESFIEHLPLFQAEKVPLN